MNYRQNGLTTDYEQVHPWCIVRSFPDMQSELIIRFHHRSDAEAHLQILKSNNPTASYEIVFDILPSHSD
ncbi:MAG: hypothetical protein LDL41_10510 [Coleofasciculus sp. S288]|nr:hypothetical protein [Coleofasciculus sp. S288]